MEILLIFVMLITNIMTKEIKIYPVDSCTTPSGVCDKPSINRVHSLNNMEILEGEIWKDINGYEGLYQVSNYGRVKSLEKFIIVKNRHIKIIERIMKTLPHKDKYRTTNSSRFYSTEELYELYLKDKGEIINLNQNNMKTETIEKGNAILKDIALYRNQQEYTNQDSDGFAAILYLRKKGDASTVEFASMSGGSAKNNSRTTNFMHEWTGEELLFLLSRLHDKFEKKIKLLEKEFENLKD